MDCTYIGLNIATHTTITLKLSIWCGYSDSQRYRYISTDTFLFYSLSNRLNSTQVTVLAKLSQTAVWQKESLITVVTYMVVWSILNIKSDQICYIHITQHEVMRKNHQISLLIHITWSITDKVNNTENKLNHSRQQNTGKQKLCHPLWYEWGAVWIWEAERPSAAALLQSD